MRIPIPIVIVACLLAIVVVWMIGTRNTDFTTPPTPQDLVEISRQWEESRPNIPPPKPINAGLLEDRDDTIPQTPVTPARPQPEKLPTGNLLHAPALSEYGTLGNKGGEAMVALATHLETKGELQRALLAWERVIDTSGPTDDERQLAVTAIKRLKSSLPPWNPDPAADLSLTLHAGATLRDKKALEDAMSTVADLISEASGNVVQVTTKTSIGNSRGLKTPRIPIAIWFSRPGTTDSGARAETPPISFMADPSEKEMLASQIEAGVYALLRAHMASETSFSPLPEYPAGVKPDDLLKHHITRLMWREFVKSMKE
ncbi:MAG: hypothetical protein H7A51_10830 [Akkermansiaceae bacterium]|nr:hypothetical protein [Akkermansiaceae bacterium]